MDYGMVRDLSGSNSTLLSTSTRRSGRTVRSRSPSPESPRKHITQVTSLFDEPKRDMLKPTGIAGDYFDGDEPFGPAYWKERFAEVLYQLNDPLQKFLDEYAVEIGEPLESLFDHELQEEMTKDLSVLASHIQANYLRPKKTQAIDGLDDIREDNALSDVLKAVVNGVTATSTAPIDTSSLSSSSAAPSGSGSGAFTRADEMEARKKDQSMKALGELLKHSKKFNVKNVPLQTKAQALHWLLTKVENPNNVELEIIKQMHPEKEEKALDYVTNRYVGRMVWMKGTVSGAITAGIEELHQDSGKNISFDDVIITHRSKYAKFLGAKTIMKASQIPGRYTSEKAVDGGYEGFYSSKRVMLEALKGKHITALEAAQENVYDALTSKSKSKSKSRS
jgi:hypothetical protein